ncbi:hypothetical protein DUI87_27681 [Hirundo rustica rustica]|uniref:Uncharacterized protein n=1 Tax=Hirundo rustica rustica TaxID=333673 RepID=A0A3M0J2B6_HIRRU|nr:hypothetical protein DUI87_27681 [Hirundo rustica rustica]
MMWMMGQREPSEVSRHTGLGGVADVPERCAAVQGPSQAGQLNKEEHKVLSLQKSKPRTLWRIPSRELGKALGHLVSTKLNKSHEKVNYALGCVGSIVTSRSRRGSLLAHHCGAHPWTAVSSLGFPVQERQGYTGESQTLGNISFSGFNGPEVELDVPCGPSNLRIFHDPMINLGFPLLHCIAKPFPVGEDEARKPYKYDCLDSENVKPIGGMELKASFDV